MKKSSAAILLSGLLLTIITAPGCIKWRPTPQFQNPVLDLRGDPALPLQVGFAAENDENYT